MDANFTEIYNAVIVEGTTVSSGNYSMLQSFATLQTVVQCCTHTDDNKLAVVELCFDRFEDAYAVWTALSDTCTQLLVTIDDDYE